MLPRSPRRPRLARRGLHAPGVVRVMFADRVIVEKFLLVPEDELHGG
jgi:hypothetical protein